MTTEKPRTRNVTSELSVGQAFDRIQNLRESRERRRAEFLADFDATEQADEDKIKARVPEDQRRRVDVMLAAMPEATAMAEEIVASRNVTADEVPERLREPLSPERLAIAGKHR